MSFVCVEETALVEAQFAPDVASLSGLRIDVAELNP